MKAIRLFGLMVAITMVFGCSKGDDGNDGGINNNDSSSSTLSTSGKRIAALVINKTEYDFFYDSSNRIIEVYYYYSHGLKTENISYSKDKIVRQPHNAELHLNSTGNLITSIGSDGKNCKYNEDGYLVSCGNTNYTWEDGNLVKIVEDNGTVKYIYTLEYDKNLNWPKNLFINPRVDSFSGILLPLGCWGKTPKNLHTKVHYEHISTDKVNKTFTYDYTFKYTFKDGYPVKVDVTGGGQKSEFIIIWE